MNKLQKIKSLVEKYSVMKMPKDSKGLGKILLQISKEAYNLGTQSIQDSHLEKDNHKIGCELESYCNVLLYRGLNKESDMLLEVASRIK